MTNPTPDAALLWARDQFKRGFSERMQAEIDEGIWDETMAVTERAEAFRAGQSRADAGLLAALERQCDTMAFVLNHFDVPAQWYDKFTCELAEDRAAIAAAIRAIGAP